MLVANVVLARHPTLMDRSQMSTTGGKVHSDSQRKDGNEYGLQSFPEARPASLSLRRSQYARRSTALDPNRKFVASG